jgi:N utilization substance protein B
MEKQQWKKRVDVVRYVYSCLVKDSNASEIIKEAFEDYEFDSNQIKVIEFFANHKEEIIEQIAPLLSASWSWERISDIDKSIIFTAYSEAKVNKTDKAIVLDQAVVNAKNYSDKKNFKFINAILEKLI